MDIGYLLVFQNNIEETAELKGVGEEVTATINSRVYQFFRSALDLELRKEFKPMQGWIIISSLSVGWVLMQPLSQSEVETSFSSENFQCPESSDKSIKEKAYPASNQIHLGAKVIGIAKKGCMLSLGGDAYLADLYPVYSGNLRFEWSW